MGFFGRVFRKEKKVLTSDQLARMKSYTLWVVPGECLVSGGTGERGTGFLVYGRLKDLKLGHQEEEIPKTKRILIVRPDHERFLQSSLASRVVYRTVVSYKTGSLSEFVTILTKGYEMACRAMEEIEKADRPDAVAILVCDHAQPLLEFLRDLKTTAEGESEPPKAA